MARVTYVKAARPSKRPRTCTKCRKPIEVGDSYKWFATRIGRHSQRKNFCNSCQIRQSDRTTSANLQTLYMAIEAAEDAMGGYDSTWGLSDFAQVLRDAAEGVREVQGMYEESADNMESGFGHETYQSQEIREKAEQVEAFADELDSAADDIESMDDPNDDESEFDLEFEGERDEEGKPADQDEWEQYVEEKRDERREAAVEAVNDALCNCPM